jgi:hypothetical protein
LSRKPIQYKVKNNPLPKKPATKVASFKERIKEIAKLCLAKSRLFLIKIGTWLIRLIKNRRFFISLASIAILILTFFAGMGLQSYLAYKADIIPRTNRTSSSRSKLNITTNIPNSTNGNVNNLDVSQSINPTTSTNFVAIGLITTLTSTEITIKDNTNIEHKLLITKDSEFVSVDAKMIKINDVKVGYIAMVYGTRDSSGNLNLKRLKVTSVK